MLAPGHVSRLLGERQRRQFGRNEQTNRREEVPPEEALNRSLEAQRKQLNSLVAQYAHLKGMPHSHVHAGLRRECGGPQLAQCSTEQVDQRIRTIKTWLG